MMTMIETTEELTAMVFFLKGVIAQTEPELIKAKALVAQMEAELARRATEPKTQG